MGKEINLKKIYKTKSEKKIPVYKKELSELEAERIYREGIISIKDLIAPASLKITPYFLRINNLYVRTLFVLTYPRYLYVGWFAPILNFPAEIDISMFFYPLPTEMMLKQLKNKVGNIEAELMLIREKGGPRDPVREAALRDLEKLRDDLAEGIEKFFQFALYVTIYAKSEKELEEKTNKLESIFGSKLVFSRRALWQQEQGFNSTLPLFNDELGVGFNMNTSPCATSFPFISATLSSDNGILYGVNLHNNSLVIFDRFSLPNANLVVFATSGAGKSYTIKLEVLRSLMFGTDVIIIDPEKEYYHLSNAVGGSYINLSLNSNFRINPFDLPKKIPKGLTVQDVIRSQVISLKGLLKIMLGGKITPIEDNLLDRAIIETYAKKDITSQTQDLSRVEMPLMQDLIEILESMQGAEDLVLKLKKYTEGTFSGIFNAPTNVEIKNQLIIFSIRDLEDELRPMAVYIIINYIWNIVREKMKKRLLVIDEAWWLMQYEDSAKFLYALVKRCRKYYLGITTITQDVADFLNSPYGKAVVTNSALQILLRQSPASIEEVAKTFMLTDSEKRFLLSCSVGEGIFFAGNNHVAIRIVASYIEDQLITSDPRQLLEIEKSKQEFAQALEKGEVDDII